MALSPYASPLSASPAGDDSETRYIARQPIFDAERNLFAYELLFRSGNMQYCVAPDPDAATINTIDFSLLMGQNSLTDGLPAFVNCTRELLIDGTVTALPRDLFVLEILETVEPDAEVLAACAKLKQLGYRLAIDDFAGDYDREPLIATSEIIKVDFSLTNEAQRAAIAARYSRRGFQMLAEKVETHEEFEAARTCGYRYFQGFFFCKPVTLSTTDIRCLHPAYVELLSSVYDPIFDVDAIRNAIRQEPSLCYRLLRYLNSAAFGVYPVRSIRHAIALLGQREMQKWTSIVTAIAMAGPRSTELITLALQRAQFAELVSGRIEASYPTEFFLAGIFSLADAMLNRDIGAVIATLPLSTTVKDALAGRNNQITEALRLAVSCERAEWEAFAKCCLALSIAESDAWKLYEEARKWVKQITAHLD
jgi:EAL and modified HD-GYP domain-containing signal transduction protein